MLVSQGYYVTSLSRSKSSEVENLKISQLACDLSNRELVFSLVKNFDAVIHTAAKAGIWGSFESYYQPNFIGSKNLVDACLENGIDTLIYTSTPSVVFGNSDINGADETLEFPSHYYTHYGHTKSLAEKYILSKALDTFRVCALRPHLIWGKGDPHILPRLLHKARKNKLMIVGDGENLVDVIHVKNAAHAHLLALQTIHKNPNMNGQAYFVGQNSPVKLWAFINQMLETQNISPIVKKIPYQFAFILGSIFEVIFKLLRIQNIDPPMTRFLAMQMGKSHYFSHDKAKKDFLYEEIISIEDGLSDL